MSRAPPALAPPGELGLPAPRPAALVGPGRRDRTATAGRPRTVLWRGIAVLTASAAASVAVLNVASPRQPPVRPALDQLVEAHAASASEDEPFTQLVPAGVRVRYQP